MDNLIAENVGKGNISDGGSQFFKENDNFKATHTIDMRFKKMLNLLAPSEPSDAATKKYADNIKSILNESINSLLQLYNTLDKTQEENKEKISKTQEEISKTQEEISKTQEEINKTQQEINEKIDNALCDVPDPVNPQDVATKEYADKINSLLNASITKLSQLYITLSRTVEEYKEKINKNQEEINKKIDDAAVRHLSDNDYLTRIRLNERNIESVANLNFIMVNASYKGLLNSDDYQFSFSGNIINEGKSIGFLMPHSGNIVSMVLETPFDFSKQQNFDNNLEYEAITSALLEIVIQRKIPKRETVSTTFNFELHYDKTRRDELKRVVVYDFGYEPRIGYFGNFKRSDVLNIKTRITEPKIYIFLKDDDIYHFSFLLKLDSF